MSWNPIFYRTIVAWVLGVVVSGWTLAVASAQSEFNEPPIRYDEVQMSDRVAKLQRLIASGESPLTWNQQQGWLPSLLEQLDVSPETQTLVFSKTSLQIRQIRPSNPRAIFFNDEVYLGYVPGGKIIELSAVDPVSGAVFYSIKQQPDDPAIQRDQSECMTCHGTTKTKNVPGYLVRSVYSLASGHPDYSQGTTTTDHTTPFVNRFGGWYITGTHGSIRHRGNSFYSKGTVFDHESGANLSSLPDRVVTDRYPVETSDIVALMVLEHQSQMHNLITRASYETRRAIHHDRQMNRIFERDPDFVTDTTRRRIQSAGDDLLEYLLFQKEAPLTSPVRGDSGFQEFFTKLGPSDKQGRSLRQLDLNTRMFKYPCSFLIYSDSFANLPPPMLDYVETKLARILSGAEASSDFDHLSEADRTAIREILLETLPRFAKRMDQVAGSK